MAHKSLDPAYFGRMLKKAKSGKISFACGDGKGGFTWVLDDKLDPKALYSKVKQAEKTTKSAYGLFVVEQGTWKFDVQQEMPSLKKKIKQAAIDLGEKPKKIKLLDPSGAEILDEDEEGGGVSTPASMTAPTTDNVAPVPGHPVSTSSSAAPPSVARKPKPLSDKTKTALAASEETFQEILATMASCNPPQVAVNAFGNDKLKQMSTAEIAGQNLAVGDVNGLFKEDYMLDLVGKKIPGANNPDLKRIMIALEESPPLSEARPLIQEMAKIRGQDAKVLEVQYERFLQLKRQAGALQKLNDRDEVPDTNELVHGDFTGSNPQLVFGKVLGDAFGIDPVFGALLSPTGGMVGPGNIALHLDDDDPTGYHGIVHDAAGYLYNYHDLGPGYNYLGKEERDTADPLTGQQAGMRFWHESLDPGKGTATFLSAIDVVSYAHDLDWSKTGDSLCDLYRNATDYGGDLVSKTVKSGADTTSEIYVKAQKSVSEAYVKVEKSMGAARKSVEKEIGKAVKTVEKELASAVSSAGKEWSSAASSVMDGAAAVSTLAGDVVSGVYSGAASAATSVVSAGTSATKAVASASDYASDKLSQAWSYVWSS